jgi:hypothetical protein
MPGIVITGHGGFATGLLQAVEQVVGPQPHCAAVDFPEQMSTAQLNDALRSAGEMRRRANRRHLNERRRSAGYTGSGLSARRAG